MLARPQALRTIQSSLKANPGAVLLGPRQCGKTTLARQIVAQRAAAGEPARSFDLEDPAHAAALSNPMLTLGSLRGLVVLDEVQRAPDLFPVLRVLMDRPTNPAKFLLLGSASPHLVRGVTESLAGRVGFIDLHGFLIDEVGSARQDALWTRGGFPRSFLADSDDASFEWRRDFLRSFTERDFASLGLGPTPAPIARLWTMVSHSHGQLLNASEFGRSLGITYKTVQRHLELLEGAFMIRTLRPWTANIGKRLVKSPKVFVRDSGLLHALLGLRDRDSVLGHPKLGASWEGFALEQVLGTLPHADAWFWGTQGGAELDLLVEHQGKRIGFEFKVGDAPTMSRSMAVALEDLELDRLTVVKPLGPDYQLSERVEVKSLESALLALAPRTR